MTAGPRDTVVQVVAAPIADISATPTQGTTRMRVGGTATFKATFRLKLILGGAVGLARSDVPARHRDPTS